MACWAPSGWRDPDERRELTEHRAPSTLSAIVGIVTLIWSASSLFAQLQEALNTIWEVQTRPERRASSPRSSAGSCR